MSGADDRLKHQVSRRNLFGGIALGMLLPRSLSAGEVRATLLDLDRAGLHNVLRGVAFLERFDDRILDDDLEALVAQITELAPEAPYLLQVFRNFRDGPYLNPRRDEEEAALRVLHHAAAEARVVGFGYTALDGTETTRRVRPLALVHPAHGIQLLAWCEKRQDFRKFFVHAMRDVADQVESFGETRCDLLQRLVEAEGFGTGQWRDFYED